MLLLNIRRSLIRFNGDWPCARSLSAAICLTGPLNGPAYGLDQTKKVIEVRNEPIRGMQLLLCCLKTNETAMFLIGVIKQIFLLFLVKVEAPAWRIPTLERQIFKHNF